MQGTAYSARMSTPLHAATHAQLERDKLTGLACGVGAGALWGLVFLAPELVSDFSPLMLTIGRHLCYGLIAAALAAPRWRTLVAGMSRPQWVRAFWLAMAGNTLYYMLLSSAVQNGGIAMTSLVVGFMPVAVTLIGSRDHGAVPLRRLAPSLLFCAAGAVCIGWQALAGPGSGTPGGSWSGEWFGPVFGLLCALGALAAWTAYAVGNARALKHLTHLSAHDWSLLIGIVTGLQCLALIPVALVLESSGHGHAEWVRFAVVSVGVAVLASVLGNALWNRMSQLLPLTLVGQMILFETLFALVYGLAWEQRLPSWLEVLALGCVVMSVGWCLKAHRAPAHAPQP